MSARKSITCLLDRLTPPSGVCTCWVQAHPVSLPAGKHPLSCVACQSLLSAFLPLPRSLQLEKFCKWIHSGSQNSNKYISQFYKERRSKEMNMYQSNEQTSKKPITKHWHRKYFILGGRRISSELFIIFWVVFSWLLTVIWSYLLPFRVIRQAPDQ